MRVVDTDNFGGDYPDEKFVFKQILSEVAATEIAEVLNKHLSGEQSPRYYKVVRDDYKLQPGFEP